MGHVIPSIRWRLRPLKDEEYEAAPPPKDPGNRRIWDEAGQPLCFSGVPQAWVGVVLEAIQWMKKECPGIRFLQFKEKCGDLRIYFETPDPKASARANEIVREAAAVVREIDQRLQVTRWAGRAPKRTQR